MENGYPDTDPDDPSKYLNDDFLGWDVCNYSGPVPTAGMPGCKLVDTDNTGTVVNAGLYCFENAEITADNCGNSYLEFAADGCSAESIVGACTDIPVEGDYTAISTGYYYQGAVDTNATCTDVRGTYVQ